MLGNLTGKKIEKITIGGVLGAASAMTANEGTISKVDVTGNILGTFTANKIERVGSVSGHFLDPNTSALDPYTDHCFASRIKRIFDHDGDPVSA
jgi:hypothetical protein